MQLALEVKNAEIIAYEIKGRSLYKRGRGFLLPFCTRTLSQTHQDSFNLD